MFGRAIDPHRVAPAVWACAAKQGVGSAAGRLGRVWFTLAEGSLSEIFWPRPDTPVVRAVTLEVEGARDVASSVRPFSGSVPAYHVVTRPRAGGWLVRQEVAADPALDVVRIRAHVGGARRIFARVEARLATVGDDPRARATMHREPGVVALESPARGVALAALRDGSPAWHEEVSTRRLGRSGATHALVCAIDVDPAGDCLDLAIGFGPSAADARLQARGSLLRAFDDVLRDYVEGWSRLAPDEDAARVDATVLNVVQSRSPIGGGVASLATPWGEARRDPEVGTYHDVWTRDLVEGAGALVGIGQREIARRTLGYLRLVQRPDGGYWQNMRLSGEPHWRHDELDEVALPILLADLAERHGAIGEGDVEELWPTVRAAAGYLARKGPSTAADRWEDEAGYTPFTLAACISALLVAADHAERRDERDAAGFLRDLADAWNASIERWTFDGAGFYRRIAPAPTGEPAQRFDDGGKKGPQASPDALALVRFGLRDANDPKMVVTVRAIDERLRVTLPQGPCWRRYERDHYGEDDRGRAFASDHPGRGRAWPLLVGERAHYELAAGRVDAARALLRTMESFANEQGLLPEQVWDARDLPKRGLLRGGPTRSATPLAWAHAEHLKLILSLRDGRVFDMPPRTHARYVASRTPSAVEVWRAHAPRREVAAGKPLRVLSRSPEIVQWREHGGKWRAVETHAPGPLEVQLADLPAAHLPAGARIELRIGDRRFSIRLTDPTRGNA